MGAYHICSYFTLWTGLEGLLIYQEIHQNFWNILIHVLFLPFVFFGCYLLIPTLISKNLKVKLYIKMFITLSYTLFYLMINWQCALLICLMGAILMCLTQEYNIRIIGIDKEIIITSLKFIAIPLIIQEIFGHLLFEQVTSLMNFSYILNAIMYSPLFFMMKLVGFNTCIFYSYILGYVSTFFMMCVIGYFISKDIQTGGYS